jgi:hypothetical protein
MAAQVAAGTTPPDLSRFLRETFPRRGPRWLVRLLGPRKDAAYAVRRIEAFDDKGFFVRSCVFEVTAAPGLLEGHHLPHGGSFGLFALTSPGLSAMAPRDFSYLTRHPEAVEELLRREARPIDQADALMLATLMSETLDRRGNSSGIVLQSADDLVRFRQGTHLEQHYELDAREWERVRARVEPPVIMLEGPSRWRLEYCSVFGWMDDKDRLSRHRVTIDAEYHIEIGAAVLSKKVFRRTPALRY